MNILESYIEAHRGTRKNVQELLWAQIWRDARIGIPWIEDLPAISPGRWAVGYNYLYVMTRVLNEMMPHSVLDIGLGISSTLISCYFEYYKYNNGRHTIIEQNEDWINFYLRKEVLSQASEIIHCEYEEMRRNGFKYTAFKNLQQKIENRKYSVISIDAPLGSSRYSRRDIVPLIPNILEDSFVIIIDDSNRRGEKDTINEIKYALHKSELEYCIGSYEGSSDCCVITSADNRFFCTM